MRYSSLIRAFSESVHYDTRLLSSSFVNRHASVVINHHAPAASRPAGEDTSRRRADRLPRCGAKCTPTRPRRALPTAPGTARPTLREARQRSPWLETRPDGRWPRAPSPPCARQLPPPPAAQQAGSTRARGPMRAHHGAWQLPTRPAAHALAPCGQPRCAPAPRAAAPRRASVPLRPRALGAAAALAWPSARAALQWPAACARACACVAPAEAAGRRRRAAAGVSARAVLARLSHRQPRAPESPPPDAVLLRRRLRAARACRAHAAGAPQPGARHALREASPHEAARADAREGGCTRTRTSSSSSTVCMPAGCAVGCARACPPRARALASRVARPPSGRWAARGGGGARWRWQRRGTRSRGGDARMRSIPSGGKLQRRRGRPSGGAPWEVGHGCPVPQASRKVRLIPRTRPHRGHVAAPASVAAPSGAPPRWRHHVSVRVGGEALRQVVVRGRGDPRHLAGGLHRRQAQVRAVPPALRRPLAEEALPQGVLPRRRAPHLRTRTARERGARGARGGAWARGGTRRVD